MFRHGKNGITQIFLGIVLIGFSGFFSGPFSGMGMTGRHGGSLWKWLLLAGGIASLVKGGSFLLSGYSHRRKNKPDMKHQEIVRENTILRIAEQNNGTVTVTKASLELGKSLDETEKILNTLVSKGHATMEISDEGKIHYFFADFYNK